MNVGRQRWSVARIRAAMARRMRGPYASLDRMEHRLEALADQVQELRSKQVPELGSKLESDLGKLLSGSRALRDDLLFALRALAADEARNRRLLQSLREGGEYERAWTDERPLISVTVATIGRPELTSRSLPSILGQTYEELEVIVVADGGGPEVEPAVTALGDSRIRFLDPGPRQTWTDDPVKLWMVGATRPRNAALQLARGRWIVEFDDDDAMRPECLEALLDLARSSRAEAVYGQVRQHGGSDPRDLCAFPPRYGHFSWGAGMYHAGLRFFGRELLAADLGLPGDWWLAERMLRAGVRFAMRDEVLCDAYASDRGPQALEQGRPPWADPDE